MTQWQTRDFRASYPEIGGRDFYSGVDHRTRKVNLSIEFQRACLYGYGARRGSRLGGLVDDAHAHSEPGQPQREHKPGRPGPDDEDKAVAHRSPSVSEG